MLVARLLAHEGTTPDVAELKIFGSGWATEVPAAEPTVWDVGVYSYASAAVLDYIRIRVDSTTEGGQVDELRIGTTWASVVPEPATLSLLAFGMLFLRRRRA